MQGREPKRCRWQEERGERGAAKRSNSNGSEKCDYFARGKCCSKGGRIFVYATDFASAANTVLRDFFDKSAVEQTEKNRARQGGKRSKGGRIFVYATDFASVANTVLRDFFDGLK